jgi:Glycosyltransferase family 87
MTAVNLVAALKKPAALVALWFVVLVTLWNVCRRLPDRATRLDFSIYYISATALHEGYNPYTTDFNKLEGSKGFEIKGIQHATDPPTFLLCIEPLAFMTPRAAFFTWTALNALMLSAALIMLLGKESGLDTRTKSALTAMGLIYVPVAEHFYFGQSKILILLMLVLFVRLTEQKLERSAGLCLALAGLLRIFPLLLLGYFVIQRRWRVFTWTLLGLALGGMITAALLGVSETLDFRKGVLLTTSSQFLNLLGNIALGSFVSRMFWAFVPAQNRMGIDAVRQIAVMLADCGLIALTVHATLRLRPLGDQDSRALALWIVASVLCSPTAWVHYMVLFLILFAQLASAASRGASSSRALGAAIVSYILVLLAPYLVEQARLLDHRIGYEWGHAKLLTQSWSPDWRTYVMVALAETWFLSAMVAYLAAYWFTVDTMPPAGKKQFAGAFGR